MNKYTFCWIYY